MLAFTGISRIRNNDIRYILTHWSQSFSGVYSSKKSLPICAYLFLSMKVLNSDRGCYLRLRTAGAQSCMATLPRGFFFVCPKSEQVVRSAQQSPLISRIPDFCCKGKCCKVAQLKLCLFFCHFLRQIQVMANLHFFAVRLSGCDSEV